MAIKEDESIPIRVYQLNDEEAEFEELEIDEAVKLYEILQSKLILYFIDESHYRSYIWAGSESSTRMKFIAAGRASNVRDQIGAAIKISTVDEGDETMGFKVLVGLIKQSDNTELQTGPAYTGTAEDEALLRQLTLDKIVLLLEKISIPEGYKREMVVEGKNIYGYQEAYKEYMGEIILEKNLYRLKEQVPDGPYLAKDLIPRVLMSYNKVVIIELLKEMTPEEIEEQIEKEKKIDGLNNPATPFTQ
jgi:hypothetical protein